MNTNLTLEERVVFEHYESIAPSLVNLKFPENKKQISKLNYDQKMEWYATRQPKDVVFLGNDPEFQRFWKWHVVIPVKIRRMYYRIKNLEIFKHYKHISEMKPKMKKHGI